MNVYQSTLGDDARINTLAIQPGRTAYIDECGNFGFDFEKDGVSKYYIVCAVIVKNEDIQGIEEAIDEVRRTNFSGGEMKSSSIGGNHNRRKKILAELLSLDFSIVVLIADKQAFYAESALVEYKKSFVKFLHQKLYDSMYSCYPKLKIIEDEYGSTDFQKGFRDYVHKNKPIPDLFNDYGFDYENSRCSNIVQVADIIAGSVMQKKSDESAPDVLALFGGKLRDVINFPQQMQPRLAGMEPEEGFDNQIYALADHCATNYINSNQKSDGEDIRMRVMFLRRLLFTVRNINSSTYIHSSEMTKQLAAFSGKKVTRDYLYRRIIAPLRDAGVLIASSSHGYKIPSCINDIYTYVNQTNGIVSPMLSRIQKCRVLIKKQTDGKLDIMDDPLLFKYKRYFGEY